MSKILTLWDIDGNLVNLSKYQTLADQKAIESVFEVKVPLEEIEKNFGLPAKEVLAIPLRKAGISEKKIQKGMDKMLNLYAKELEKQIKIANKESNILLPGVLGFLKRMKELNIPMAIVTGNIKIAGEGIIEGLNLSNFFESKINSFGDNINYRYEIISQAIEKAKKQRIINENSKVYIFGDTAHDVDAAKKNKCISIAVIKNSNDSDSSPGGESYRKRKEALKKSKPDFLFDDYTNFERIITILGIK